MLTKRPLLLNVDRTGLRTCPSEAKCLEEPDFDVQNSPDPPKSDENNEKPTKNPKKNTPENSKEQDHAKTNPILALGTKKILFFRSFLVPFLSLGPSRHQNGSQVSPESPKDGPGPYSVLIWDGSFLLDFVIGKIQQCITKLLVFETFVCNSS